MEIEIDKESSFTLEMKIDGEVSSKEPPKMRFSIMNEGVTISLNAKRIDNGVYEINVPKLKNILKAGEYEANVEVFIDGKHFIPLKETVILKQELKPTVKLGESTKSPSEPTITVESIKIKPASIKKTEEIVTVNK